VLEVEKEKKIAKRNMEYALREFMYEHGSLAQLREERAKENVIANRLMQAEVNTMAERIELLEHILNNQTQIMSTLSFKFDQHFKINSSSSSSTSSFASDASEGEHSSSRESGESRESKASSKHSSSSGHDPPPPASTVNLDL